jgi:hypothetical protein
MAKHKWQHFLPQMYLKAFIDPERVTKGQHDLWIYRAGADPKPRGPKGTAAEPHLYTSEEVKEDPLIAETGLAEMESIAVKHLEKLRGGEIELSDQEKAEFAIYVAIQVFRTPLAFARSNTLAVELMRQGWKKTLDGRGLEKLIQKVEEKEGEKLGVDIEALEKLLRDVADGKTELVQQSTGWNVKVMLERSVELGNIIEKMHWALFEATGGMAWITSDNPVQIADPPAKAAGPKGFKFSDKMQVIFPLSPRYMLLCDKADRKDEKAQAEPNQVSQSNRMLIERAFQEVYASFRSDVLKKDVDEIFAKREPVIPQLPQGMLD